MFDGHRTIHAVGCGKSVLPWLDRLVAKPNLICVNSMGPLMIKPAHWLMIDPIRDPGISTWAKANPDVRQFGTRYNLEDLAQGARLIKTAGNGVHGDPWKNGFFMVKSSLHAACHLGWALGAERVIVWGLDMDGNHARANGDGGQAWGNTESILQGWRRLRDGLRDLACDVLNANPASGCRELPFIDPEAAIGE